MIARSFAQHSTCVALGVLLLAALLLKTWFHTRYPHPPNYSWIDTPVIVDSTSTFEAALGLIFVSGLWPRPAWFTAVVVFSLFAIITAVEAIRGKSSCGCFGAVQVRPIYTMGLDVAAVAALVVTGVGGVIGRAKPASDGRAKTGHFEKAEIRPLSFVPGSRRERTMGWRINSRWRKFKQFWHLREVAGPTGTSPGNLAFTARRSGAIFAFHRPRIQNRPARPSARRR